MINVKILIEKLEKLTSKKVSLVDKTKFEYENVPKPEELIAKCRKANCLKSLDGISLGKAKNGKYFVYTHRARSKYYDKPEDITIKDIKFIETTG